MGASINEICQCIYIIRGHQIILDSELAKRYQVEVGSLKRAVRRNTKRFPDDFMFELTRDEFKSLICQIGISKKSTESRGGNRFAPFAFTELGVAMLSSILSSDRAIEVSIEIMKAFVEFRRQGNLRTRVELLEERMERFEAKSNSTKLREPVKIIQEAVANHWGLQVEDLKSGVRKKSISLPRQIAVYLVRKQLNMSFGEIGWYFGKRDHTSIMHAYRKICLASGLQEILSALEAEIGINLRGIQPARLRSLLA